MTDEEVKRARMQRAFLTVQDIMKAWDVEYPFAIIWQTFDADGNQDYTTMRPCDTWDVNHGTHREHLANIVHEDVEKSHAEALIDELRERTHTGLVDCKAE